MSRFAVALLLAAALARPAQASLTVLVGEPFGKFGTMMPVGHISLYLDRVCADGPVRLRMCRAGEAPGVAIARLDKIGDLDWIDSPIMTFLYGTERAEDVLPYATPEAVKAIRQKYRQANLLPWFPDGTETIKHNREWWETVGVAYSRKVYAYQLDTTREQDEAFVELMNADSNRHAYRLHKMNCADFVANAVNFFYPGIVRSNHVADFALMTPKQVARCVWTYGKEHPEANLKLYEIPQVPGTLRRSRPVRGSAEMIVKTKRYDVLLGMIQPELLAVCWITYLDRGRWSMEQGGTVEGPLAFVQQTEPAAIATK